jgi:PEP-CTERM motif
VEVENYFPFTGTYTDNDVTDPGLTNFTGTSTIYTAFVTPEPASLVLLVGGLVGPIGFSLYRKRSARSRAS